MFAPGTRVHLHITDPMPCVHRLVSYQSLCSFQLFVLVTLAANLLPWAPVSGSHDSTSSSPDTAARGQASSSHQCNLNPGIQFFELEGYKTAAVIEDGILDTEITEIFDESLELAQRALASQYLSTEIIPFSVNVLYLEDASGNRVLFDAGNGPNGEFGPGLGRVVHTLEASGISRHSITHVLISHAHLDHIGGVLLDTNGTLAYPGAKVYVSRQEYEYWRGAGKLFNASDIDPEYLEFLAQGANDVFDQAESQLELFEYGAEILPGITGLEDGTWHSPGHAVYAITGPSSGASAPPQALFLGDVLDNEVIGLENPYLRSRFDDDQAAGPPGKTRALDALVKSGAIGVFAHVTFPSAVRVVRQGLLFRAIKLIPHTSGGVGMACAAAAGA